MSLFTSKKKEATATKKIRPTVIRTQNVAKELINIAKAHKISVEKLDFNLLEVQTYIRMNHDKMEGEWEEISSDELHELDDVTALLNPNFQIKQMYEVEIFSKIDDEENRYKDFKIAVGANSTKCKVYLSIKEGSSLSFTPRFDIDITNIINKRKIRAGILVDVFDEMLETAISKLSARVRIEEKIFYKKTETILIAQSIEPTLTIDDKLILHFNEKEDIDDDGKIDYSARGYIKSVSKGELLIEYIKPKKGEAGRNCRGEYIAPTEPKVRNVPKFEIDHTIRFTEEENSTKYFAKVNGYVALDGFKYTIKSEVDINEISFKKTGSILTDLDSDVSISVKEKNAIKDAVGTGMKVEVSEINIDGNVGANTDILAIKVSVEGQTHKTSKITAEDININVHKGEAIGENVHITRIEHGKVTAKKVDIGQALGGEIDATDVYIELCGSYVNITASRLIEIQKMQGSENIFTIDPLSKKDVRDNLEENKREIIRLEKNTKYIHDEIKKYTNLVKDNATAFNDVKKRLVRYKKNGIKMPESFVKQYKQFQKMQDNLVLLKKELIIKTDNLVMLKAKTSSFQESIFDARIINRGRWKGYNEIKFNLIDPPMELVYKPNEDTNGEVFAVVETEDGDYEIKVVKE